MKGSVWCRVLGVVVVGVLVVSCSGGVGSSGVAGVEFPAIDLSDPEYLRTRGLLEREIGIERVLRVEELIAGHVHSIFPYVTYRTHAARIAEAERRSMEVYDVADDELEDVRFELLVDLVLLDANDTRR